MKSIEIGSQLAMNSLEIEFHMFIISKIFRELFEAIRSYSV